MVRGTKTTNIDLYIYFIFSSPDDDIGIVLSCVCSFISLETLWAQLEKLWNSDVEDILIESGLCKK